MNVNSILKTSFRTTLLAAGLTAGLGLSTVGVAAEESAMPKAHSDGLGAVISDTAITAKVKSKLMGEESLKDCDIDVTTTNGVVTLKGMATNGKAKDEAEKAARSVEGVKSVDNSLVTASSSKAAAKTKKAAATTKRVVSDSWITTKVKSELLADSVAKGFDVSVETMHGVVVLKGTLKTQDAAEHVKDIAAKVQGVKSVDTSALMVSGE